MATNHGDLHNFNAGLTAAGITATGTIDLSGATVTQPSNQFAVLRYVSQSITQAALTGGAATCTVALTGEPTTSIPLAAYVVTSGATTSSAGGTTGLTVKIGTSLDDDGYVAAISVFGAAGRKEGAPGVMLGGYRAGDSLIASFTATGGAADIAHIDALALKVVVLYATVAAE